MFSKSNLNLGDFYRVLFASFVVALVGLVAAQSNGILAAVGVGIVIFSASFAGGAALGFLFGVPRVLAKSENEVVPAAGGAAGAAPPVRRLLQSNTNLEKISDWLTTLLVGVGLSQLHNINDALVGLRDFVTERARVFEGASGAMHAGVLPAVAPPILIFGVFAGFLLMYLYTRVVLVRLLDAVERDLLKPAESEAVVEAAQSISPNADSFVANNLSQGTNVSVDDALNVMFDALYRPGGYRQVIELAGRLHGGPVSKRPEYWFYLAAAFGQQLHERSPNDLDGRTSDRDNALDAARHAVRIDATYRQRLWFISDPAGPDRDLQDLRNDPEFMRLVGRG